MAALPFWGALWWYLAPVPGWPLREPVRALWLVLVYPLLEEAAFRGYIQGRLLTRPGWAAPLAGPLSRANIATSLLFALLHLPAHPWGWAAAVAVPSLLFGLLRERHGSIVPGLLAHVYYNAGWFWLFGP